MAAAISDRLPLKERNAFVWRKPEQSVIDTCNLILLYKNQHIGIFVFFILLQSHIYRKRMLQYFNCCKKENSQLNNLSKVKKTWNMDYTRINFTNMICIVINFHFLFMLKILPGLYVGNLRDSKDSRQLDIHKITHILSIHDDDARKPFKVRPTLLQHPSLIHI